ncbi:hypothetical protein L798_05922 [Zootermopsis nevadensis]|uniref:Uncharacterized protein n=1 Tax=Zootermopsis nevadensis TaxID=136037 RepID=A0A067QH77_ZOONE|nr:hypothetical protein L798_05922 [Zootermopsis nevadensis]
MRDGVRSVPGRHDAPPRGSQAMKSLRTCQQKLCHFPKRASKSFNYVEFKRKGLMCVYIIINIFYWAIIKSGCLYTLLPFFWSMYVVANTIFFSTFSRRPTENDVLNYFAEME